MPYGPPIRLAHVFSSSLWIPWYDVFFQPFVARGWEVTIICPDGPEVASASQRGLRWLPISMKRSVDLRGDVATAVELARYFVRDRFDIIHTHNAKVSMVARVVAGLTRMPSVVHTLHGVVWSLETPRPLRDAHALLERIACLSTDLVLAQSQEDRATYLGARVIPEDRIVTLGNGVSLARFDPTAISAEAAREAREAMGIADHQVLAVCPARLVREKGIVELLEAAEILRQRGSSVRVAIAGLRDPDKPDAVDDAAIDRAAAHGVVILGERRDMPLVYAASDIVVLPSWREGLPRALIEGAAMGKPLVATDIRGCREIVAGRDHGLLVPVRSPTFLADALDELGANPRERARMGANNVSMAREKYDLEPVLRRIDSLYEQLLRRSARS